MTDSPSWDEILELVTRLESGGFENAAVTYGGDVSIRLSRSEPLASFDSASTSSTTSTPADPARVVASPPASAAPAAPVSPAEPEPTKITAPMIGVFYRQSSPGSPPFVEAGQAITADTTIGIIEIMKLMNPVKAGIDGVIRRFVVTDGEAVEFGQTLALLDPVGS